MKSRPLLNARRIVGGAPLSARAATVLMLGLSILILIAATERRRAAVKDEIQASEFVLTGENGKPVAKLTVDENGPGLVFLDEAEQPRVRLGMSPDQKVSELSFFEPFGNEGEPVPRLRFGSGPSGSAITLHSTDGAPRIQAAVGGGTVGIWILGDRMDKMVQLTIEDNKGQIQLFDADGKRIWNSDQKND